jgi:glycosyl transferase family 1
MLISYCGNRKNKASDGKSFNTENHIALTLERLGHTVNFIQEDELIFASLPSRVAGSDMFLWTRSWPDKVTLADLKAIEAQGIPTVSFHLDLYSNIARDGGMSIGSPFWHTQYVFSPEGSAQAKEIFKLHGINQFYLPPGVFQDECYLAEPVDEFKHDIVFVGGGVEYMHKEWDYRGLLIRWIQNTYGDRFVKYGHPQRWLRGKELNQLYASSKIVIGDTLCKDFTDSYYYSDRAFETTGRGGFLLHPYIPGITDHFVDRKEAVFYSYGNFQQLERLINYYLEHEDERRAIQLAGHERTKTTSSYTQRMNQMLKVLKEEGAI